MMHAKGADLSHWQSKAQFDAVIRWASFVGVKLTQGNTYIDPTGKARWDQLEHLVVRDKLVCRIAYHYLMPNVSAEAQAKHFLRVVGHVGPQAVLALDYEEHGVSPSIAEQFIRYVNAHVPHPDCRRVVYISSSAHASAFMGTWGLWLADWSKPYVPPKPWTRYNFLQYSGTGLDLDEYNGTRRELARYVHRKDWRKW